MYSGQKTATAIQSLEQNEKPYSKSCKVSSQGLKIVQVVSIVLQVNFFDHKFFGCLSVIVAKMDGFLHVKWLKN